MRWWCEGKGGREIIGGGGGVLWRRKREKRSKEEREGEHDQEGIWDHQEGNERTTFDQRGHWEKRKKEVFGEEEEGGFFEDQSSGLLGLVFCLMVIVVFH